MRPTAHLDLQPLPGGKLRHPPPATPVRKPNAPDGPAADAGADPVSRFEAALKELEDIVARMERGELPLEESLKLFERGVALTRECRGSLETAELRVRKLLQAEPEPGAAVPDED